MMMQVGLRLERLRSGPRGSSDAHPWVTTPLVQAGPFVEFWDKAMWHQWAVEVPITAGDYGGGP